MRSLKKRSSIATVGVLLVSVGMPSVRVDAQVITQQEMERLLAETVRHVLDGYPEGKYRKPVLVSVGLEDQLRGSLDVDTLGLGEAVSEATGVPVWDGEQFCDTTQDPPHWRMRNADFRMSLTLAYASADTVRVRIALSAGTSLAGSTVKQLELVEESEAWIPTGFVGSTLHARSEPCGSAGGSVKRGESVRG